MRPLLPAFRGLRRGETKTPVPYASRFTSGGFGGLLSPSGDEAQLRAVGGNGTLFAIVEAYTTAMAGVDWHLYRSLPPGAAEGTERPLVTSHAALDLWDKPNNFYDQPLFVKTATQHLELVGTGFVVVVKVGSLPIELWPVRPDRMEPVPHAEKFLAGWIYHGPGGEQVPLSNDVVIRMVQNPCPWDPYRGMGAVQSVMTALSGAAAAEEWHRKFFINSARPDGVITLPTSLGDTEFDEFNERWKEAHQGVNNAWRVAVLEHGAEWKPTGYSPHDMMFVDLQKADAEKTREAYRMSLTVLGQGETLNRAVAEAQMFQFSATHVVPRLKAVWAKGLLNGRLLPMYGPTGQGLEFGYVDPTPEDKEAKDRNIIAVSTAYKNYVDAGVDGSDPAMLRHLALPVMKWAPKPGPAPTPPPPAIQPAEPEARLAIAAHQHGHARTPRLAIAAAGQGSDGESDAEPDLSGVLDDLNAALEQLEKDYQPILAKQIDSLADQVERAIEDRLVDDATAVSGISVPPELLGDETLREAMELMASAAATRAAGETAAEDVELDEDDLAEQVEEDTAEIADLATAVAGTVAGSLALSAATEALRLWAPGVAGKTVAGQVRAFLKALKGSGRLAAFGAALHRATNLGRGAAFSVALRVKPEGRAIASETNDRHRCGPCGDFDGHVFSSIDAAQAVYGGGGYPGCLGKGRCRGTWYLDWSG